jgi:hypothetical protein
MDMNRRSFLTKAFQCGATVPLLGKIDDVFPTKHTEPDIIRPGFLDYDLDAIDAIKVVYFKPADRPDLCKLIEDRYKENGGSNVPWEEIVLGNVIYYEYVGTKDLITWAARYTWEEPFSQLSLPDILKQETPSSYRDILYAVTCFNLLFSRASRFCRDPFAQANFTRGAILDEMLQESRGNIFYRDQLETIFQIAGGFDSVDARRFCTNFFLQEDDVIKKIDELQWVDGLPLREMLEERIITREYDYSRKKKCPFAIRRYHEAALALYRGLMLHSKNKTAV